MDETRPAPVRVSTLLQGNGGLALLSAIVAPITMLLSPLLVGFGLYGLLTEYVLRHHVKTAFGREGRRSLLGAAVVAALALVSVGVAWGWCRLCMSEYPRVGTLAPLGFFGGASLLYFALGWALAPLAMFVALSSDPAAPADPRARLRESLRVAQALPRFTLARALFVSGALLLVPFAAASLLGVPLWGTFYLLISISCFPALSSALAVHAYAQVRGVHAQSAPRLSRAPGSLIALGLVAAGLCVAALRTGADAPAWSGPLLVAAWCGVLAVGARLASVVRLARTPRFRLEQPPGRALLEGSLRFAGEHWSEGVRLDCEGVSVSIPSSVAPVGAAGDLATLIGDFDARPADFRCGADLPWPRGATLSAAPLDALVERRLESACYAGFVLLAAICLVAGWVGVVASFIVHP